jgi:hypothetical protein
LTSDRSIAIYLFTILANIFNFFNLHEIGKDPHRSLHI